MQLLATSSAVVFDRRYPAEYRFLSYFARLAEQMTERFDEGRHPGVTPFFFGDRPTWGPVPFESDLIDVPGFRPRLLAAMWDAWTTQVRQRHPDARYYAEKLAVPVEPLRAAGIPLRLIDLVRDPRDMLASIRSFSSRGISGFDRRADQSEDDYLESFLMRVGAALDRMIETAGDFDRLTLRYEDLASDLAATARRVGGWLGVELDAEAALAERTRYEEHRTTASVEQSIGRWRRDLGPAEAERIADALRGRLEPFGYDL